MDNDRQYGLRAVSWPTGTSEEDPLGRSALCPEQQQPQYPSSYSHNARPQTSTFGNGYMQTPTTMSATQPYSFPVTETGLWPPEHPPPIPQSDAGRARYSADERSAHPNTYPGQPSSSSNEELGRYEQTQTERYQTNSGSPVLPPQAYPPNSTFAPSQQQYCPEQHRLESNRVPPTSPVQLQPGVRGSERVAAQKSRESGLPPGTVVYATSLATGQAHPHLVPAFPYTVGYHPPGYAPFAVPLPPNGPTSIQTGPTTSTRKRLASQENPGAEAVQKAKKSKLKKTGGSTAAVLSQGSSRKSNLNKDSQMAGNSNIAESNVVVVTGNLIPELQIARCMSNKYKNEAFPRCVSCTRRWAGDTCRFQGVRYFLKNEKGVVQGVSFIDNQKADGPSHNFPTKWNVTIQAYHIQRVKRSVAERLLPMLKEELQHVSTPPVIFRPRETDVRATCDVCMTSLFSSSWMCRSCGREACAECFSLIRALTYLPPNSQPHELAEQQTRREQHARTSPLTLACSRRIEHTTADFTPVSRFARAEIQEAISEMEKLISLPNQEVVDTTEPEVNWTYALSTVPRNQDQESTLNGAVEGLVLMTESHPTRSINHEALTDEAFHRVWKEGDPIVATGILDKMKLSWDPAYFVERYGDQQCTLFDCQSEDTKKLCVRDFFNMFGKYQDRDARCWKLKDWPMSSEFKVMFPDLSNDFDAAVPAPSYVRRDGALNVSAHFPSNSISPDLGPKMYNALATLDNVGTLGTTRLHMDMSDAFNVMTYAASTPDGATGFAVWDIFKAADSDRLRQFLREKHGQTTGTAITQDPIHSQMYYIDQEQRKELSERYGVKPHRIIQRPGEGVFIPAGCAHQVLNRADCIKVAIDFVSPENLARCEILTKEFRALNASQVWKEDVLQLKTMMWYAWLGCRRQERERERVILSTSDMAGPVSPRQQADAASDDAGGVREPGTAVDSSSSSSATAVSVVPNTGLTSSVITVDAASA